MRCVICETRRPRRACPGVGGDICAICCGTEREVTVSCPLDCEYLQEARRHDKPPELDVSQIPNRDIQITETFLEDHEALLLFLSQTLGAVAAGNSDVVDSDVREGLEALIRTYRTLQSGLIYQNIPTNPLAAGIYSLLQGAADQFRDREKQESGIPRTRDNDVLGSLVILQRLEYDHNNGRRKGRAFIDFLDRSYSPPADSDPGSESSLILP